MLAGFASMAVLIAAVGLYGLIAYSVSQRTREFGVRMALGAAAGHIKGMVIREGTVLVGVGVVTGVAVAPWRSSPAFPPASCPAWRAARTNPIAVLRGE